MILPDREDPPRHFRVPIHRSGRDWLTDNKRLYWRARARLVKDWRATAMIVGGLYLPELKAGAHIICELRFADRRRRDPNNWNPTAKACIDGFVDAGIFPDDHSGLIVGPDMRLGPVVRPNEQQIIFHLWPKEPPA